MTPSNRKKLGEVLILAGAALGVFLPIGSSTTCDNGTCVSTETCVTALCVTTKPFGYLIAGVGGVAFIGGIVLVYLALRPRFRTMFF